MSDPEISAFSNYNTMVYLNNHFQAVVRYYCVTSQHFASSSALCITFMLLWRLSRPPLSWRTQGKQLVTTVSTPVASIIFSFREGFFSAEFPSSRTSCEKSRILLEMALARWFHSGLLAVNSKYSRCITAAQPGHTVTI